MFEKIGRLAEAAATNVSVSRRGFFGQLGRGALVVAGALGGVLGAAAPAPAAQSYVTCCGSSTQCKPPSPGCLFSGFDCAYGGGGTCVWICDGRQKTSRCTGRL